MADHATGDQDLFRDWLASSQAFFSAQPTNAPLNDALREKCAGLFSAWNRFAQAYAGASDSARGAVSGGPFDPVGWLDAAGGSGAGDLWRWFGGPDGGNPWIEQRDALIASREWLTYSAALERYRAVMAAAWLRAFKRFAEDLAGKSAPGAAMPDWEAIQACWQQAADAELATAQRSDDFLAAQRDLVRARLDCSAVLHRQVERLAQTLGLPTRAEMDSLHQTVHDLQRQLRALRPRRGDDT